MKTNAVATTETAAVAKKGAKTAPKTTAASKKASPKKDVPKARKSKEAPVPATKESKKESAAPREGSKKQIVLDLLTRKDGATLAEIAKATGWQNHSIRGFISGTLTKKMNLRVASVKNEAGERSYHIEK